MIEWRSNNNQSPKLNIATSYGVRGSGAGGDVSLSAGRTSSADGVGGGVLVSGGEGVVSGGLDLRSGVGSSGVSGGVSMVSGSSVGFCWSSH